MTYIRLKPILYIPLKVAVIYNRRKGGPHSKYSVHQPQ